MADASIRARDGYSLAATLFRPAEAAPRATLIVNSAMAVPRRYYAAFAEAAATQGFAAVIYDYRGIGDSRPARLRGFAARAADWMVLDFEAVLAWARRELAAPRTFVVGHSFGGNALGLAPSAPTIDGAVFVAAQSGYWKHWPAPRRFLLGALWHVVTPLLPRLFGYMPGWAGLGNDVPAEVMRQWSAWCRSPGYATADEGADTSGYRRLRAPLRLLSFADDHLYAPAAAVRALIELYPQAPCEHVQVAPHQHGLGKVGHFGFFRARNRTLWPLAFDWLAARAA